MRTLIIVCLLFTSISAIAGDWPPHGGHDNNNSNNGRAQVFTATCNYFGQNQCTGGCTAVCPQGFVVTGGGGKSSNTYIYLQTSEASGSTGWTCNMNIDRSYGCADYGGVGLVTCSAQCMRL